MKKILASVLSAWMFLVSGAYAAISPEDEAAAAKEWRSYVEPMAPVGERLAALMSDPQDPQLRQEMYRTVFSFMSAAYMGLFLGDPAHPDFWPVFSMAYNMAPNPDNTYYTAPIEENGVYKISGFRGTVRYVSFQTGSGPMMVNGSGGIGGVGPVLADYEPQHQLHIKKDGSFEVILSKERPAGYKGDWWELKKGATYILIRQIANDWLHETDWRFAIDRLDRPAVKPRMTEQELQANLRQLSVWAEGWTELSIRWLKRFHDKGLINKVAAHDIDLGGATKQRYLEGLFDINPDEALIYETELPKKCLYWSLSLSDMVWGTVDYMNRQSSLNGFTAKLDKDGKFRAVLSATDPGVPNWLDTAGYAKGGMLSRWLNCSNATDPVITKVKLADLRKHLPADTPVVSAEARDAAIRLRRQGAQLRRRW